MASASTNRTLWHVAIAAVMIFLIVKVWPSIRALAGGSSGGGAAGAGGGLGNSQGSSNANPQSQNPPSFPNSGGAGSGTGGSGGNIFGLFSGWLANVLNQGQANAQTLTVDNGLASVDAEGIDAQPQALQLLDNLPSYDPTPEEDDPYGELDSNITGTDESGNNVTDYAPIDNGSPYIDVTGGDGGYGGGYGGNDDGTGSGGIDDGSGYDGGGAPAEDD